MATIDISFTKGDGDDPDAPLVRKEADDALDRMTEALYHVKPYSGEGFRVVAARLVIDYVPAPLTGVGAGEAAE